MAHTPGLIPRIFLSLSFESTSHQLLVTDMRLRSKLLRLFLVILTIASIVEASKGREQKKKNKRKCKKKKPVPSTTLTDSSVGPGREIPVRHHSGPRPELEKTKENKASIGETSSRLLRRSRSEMVSSAVSGGDTESGDVAGVAFKEAVDEEEFWVVEGQTGRAGSSVRIYSTT